ncbi:hypothetical protein TELCIR_08998 [Teladorsagia circumcincta]|uniref:Uncharacterized protein n=1 Tax=Teladorsagia circumcincta TaxID=45464 RepID=A0A2G9UG14_TELCI|nr:hypothetical protein TELCIR_08998 [Teladorsagia circumcincta]
MRSWLSCLLLLMRVITAECSGQGYTQTYYVQITGPYYQGGGYNRGSGQTYNQGYGGYNTGCCQTYNQGYGGYGRGSSGYQGNMRPLRVPLVIPVVVPMQSSMPMMRRPMIGRRNMLSGLLQAARTEGNFIFDPKNANTLVRVIVKPQN